MAKQPARSLQSAMKTVFAAFQILKANGGEMLGRDVIAQIPGKVSLTDWEKERYDKTGYIRWESILHFYTIDCMKAGYLQKEKGIWILTPEGEEAIVTNHQKCTTNLHQKCTTLQIKIRQCC